MRLGYGMHSYFKVLKYLMIMMMLLMLVMVPLMLFYARHDDLEHDLTEYMWNQYSLGNLGGSEAICESRTVDNQTPLILDCTTGVISIDKIAEKTGLPVFDIGIVPTSSLTNTYCSNEAF